MNVALCQFDQVWEDREANRACISTMIADSPSLAHADWLVFPEMTLSGFSMNTHAATLTTDDEDFFRDIARTQRLWVSYGGVKDNKNWLITLNPAGDVVNTYAKIHLYSFGGEDGPYTPGDALTTFMLDDLRVTPLVCFDLRFPYLFWQKAEETDVFVVIASWPARRAGHWMTLLRARAIETQTYVVGVNRTGNDPQLEYSGNSLLIDPLGKILCDCGTAEGIFMGETAVDKELVTKTRTRFPFLKESKTGPHLW